MDIKDTHWKCFILSKKTEKSNSVFGMINENEHGIGFQWLGNKGDGKFYAMSTHWEAKQYFEHQGPFEFTFDYNEAYRHLTKNLI